MGRGRGGGGGRVGGGGGGSGGGYQGLYRYGTFRRLFGGGLSPDTNKMLQRIAIQRGLRDADELLLVLGKQDTGISESEARELMRKELSPEALVDFSYSQFYARGMRGTPCQHLLERYKELLKVVDKSDDDEFAMKNAKKKLKKYCGHNPDGKN